MYIRITWWALKIVMTGSCSQGYLLTGFGMVWDNWGFPGGAVAKNLPANAGDTWDVGSTLGLKRCPGVGNGKPLQYSCLENPTDRRVWQAIVHGVSKSRTRLSAQTHIHTWKYWKYEYWSIPPRFLALSLFSSVVQPCPTLSDPMDCSTPRLLVHHQLPEFTQTQVHQARNAIQPSHPQSL